MSTRAKIFFIVLFVLGFATRFIFFGYPAQVVFDETYFGKYVSGYLTGNYFFDIHPPLGKLLIAVAAEIGGYQPGFTFPSIDTAFPANTAYMSLRILPMIVGSLLPALIFLVCIELGFSLEASFFSGILIVFENSLIVESRFILMNMFLLFFGFLGLLLFLKYRKKKTYLLLCLSIFFCGCALSVKWTGISFLGLIGLLFLRDLFNEIRGSVKIKDTQAIKRSFLDALKKIALFIFIPAALYVSLIALHFYLLPKSGIGDDFMSSQFQKTLFGNGYNLDPSIARPNFVSKLKELTETMYSVQQEPQLEHHPYASRWYTWPLMIRPVYYWNSTTPLAKIYLLGNPAVYWLATLAVAFVTLFGLLYFFWGYLLAVWKKKGSTQNEHEDISLSIKISSRSKHIGLFLLVAYFVNLLPFIFISRSMFLYHYFPALIFSCMILAFLYDQIKNYKHKIYTLAGISFVVMCFFLFFAPLTYGLPLTQASVNARMWLPTWK